MELSEIIKKIRIELEFSQEGLARELHIGFSTVSRWENAHTKPNQMARHAIIELCKHRKIDETLIEAFIKTK